MVDVTDLTRPGRNQSGGSDPFELFLKKFSGEVDMAFKRATVMLPLSRVRNITQGKSAQFPATGRTTAAYHVAGNNILDTSNNELSEMETGERVILVDRSCLSSVFIDELEELMSHYDVRGPVSTELGEALARKMDDQLQRLVIKGAQAGSGPVTDQGGGTILNVANSDTQGSAIVDAIRQAAQALDEKDVPDNDRFFILPPSGWYLLNQQTDFLNREFGNDGNGSLMNGEIVKVFGMRILKSNLLPTTNTSADAAPSHTAGYLNDYRVDARNTTGIGFHRSAVGTVRLRGITTEMEDLKHYQGTLMIAKNAVGHGILREEACVQVRTAAP